MSTRRALVAILVAVAASPRAHAAVGERRAAVVVGHQEGGEGTKTLRYANTDAERMYGILTTIGGVARADAFLLRDPTADQLEAALAAAEGHAQGGVVLFYYSGHAKDGELRLGGTRLPLDRLRARLSGLDARVKIAILDSCKSGELIRTKGGRVGPAFEVNAEPAGPRGLAVLASSAADEDSQESDLLGASFFTHYLASGLVGDADTNADGKVTLQEAYGYAYSRTVAQTAEARAGLQHPTYAYTLAGAGEVWLTDVARSNAALVLPRDAAGAYVIVDAVRRTLVAEIDKVAGAARRVALPAGRYEVKRRDGDGALFARLKLGDGDEVTLEDRSMERIALARNVTKGAEWAGDFAGMRPKRWTLVGDVGRQWYFGDARTELFPDLPLFGLDLELRDHGGDASTVLGFDLAAGGAPLQVRLGEIAVDSQVTQWNGGFSYLKELGSGRVQPFAGVRLSMIGVRRTFPDPAGGDDRFPTQLLLTTAPGVVAGVNWELTSRFSLGLRARASYLLYESDEDLSFGYADLGFLVKWEL